MNHDPSAPNGLAPIMASGSAAKPNDLVLSGPQIRRLMRKHHATIRGLAHKYSLELQRVRLIRANGARGFLAQEWTFLITGTWPEGG